MVEDKLIRSEEDITPESIRDKMDSIKPVAETEQRTLDNKGRDEVEYDAGTEGEVEPTPAPPVED